MFVNPKEIVERGVVKNLRDRDKQVQQCGIDICIEKLYYVTGPAYLGYNKNNNKLSKFIEVVPHKNNTSGEMTYELKAGVTYFFDCLEEVDMPEDMMMEIKTRSTMYRMGIRVGSAIYDPGYKGVVNGGIFIISNNIKIAKLEPVAQMLFMRGESADMYNGSYQNQKSGKIE